MAEAKPPSRVLLIIAGLVLQGVHFPTGVDQSLKSIAGTVAPTTMFALGLGLRFQRSLAPYRLARGRSTTGRGAPPSVTRAFPFRSAIVPMRF